MLVLTVGEAQELAAAVVVVVVVVVFATRPVLLLVGPPPPGEVPELMAMADGGGSVPCV